MLLLQQIMVWTVLGCAVVFGQNASPSFDAVSVKPVQSPAGMPGVRARRDAGPAGGAVKDAGRIHYPAISLQALLLQAFDAASFQLQGPAWMSSERFDIDATMPPDTSNATFHAMLQNLLQERFQLAFHRETRDLSGFALVVVKPGKMKEASAAPANDGAEPELKMGKDGYFEPPNRQGIFFQMAGPNAARATGRQASIAELVSLLQNQLKKPVKDATGLTAKYDFTLDYATEGLSLGGGRLAMSMGNGTESPEIYTALSTQLGLKLESRQLPAEIVVVDHIERVPKGN